MGKAVLNPLNSCLLVDEIVLVALLLQILRTMLKYRKLLLHDLNDDINDDDFFIPLTITSISGLGGQSFREWHVLP